MANIGKPQGRRSAVVAGGAAVVIVLSTAAIVNRAPPDEGELSPKISFVVDAPALVFANGFEGDGGGGGPVPPVDACAPGPLMQPDGFAGVFQSWETTWTSKRPTRPPPAPPVMHFPNTPGFPVGIGAGRDQYQSTAFTPPAGATATLFFDPHQARPQEGEPIGRPATSMFLSISPCIGDFTMGRRAWCSLSANTGSISWTTRTDVPPGSPVCQLEAWKEYHILVAPVDPTDGSVAGDYTCKDSGAPYCWVQATHRASVWP